MELHRNSMELHMPIFYGEIRDVGGGFSNGKIMKISGIF
jgi:hypothetical protein